MFREWKFKLHTEQAGILRHVSSYHNTATCCTLHGLAWEPGMPKSIWENKSKPHKQTKREFPTYFEVNKTIILPLLIWILHRWRLKNLCLQLFTCYRLCAWNVARSHDANCARVCDEQLFAADNTLLADDHSHRVKMEMQIRILFIKVHVYVVKLKFNWTTIILQAQQSELLWTTGCGI